MKSKTNKITILIILGISFVLLTNIKLNFSDGQKSDATTPKESAGFSESFIHIDGSIPNNWSDTALTYDWCYGLGTWQEPYIIENVTINGVSTGSGILIENSNNDYFFIRNCTVFNTGTGASDAGIKLINVTNGIIFNNTCSNNGNDGILLMTNCNNNTISYNIANNNSDGGIYLQNGCYENIISNNTVNDNDVGIMLTNPVDGICHHNDVMNNTARNNGVGIWLSQSDYNTVYGNILINNSKITFGGTAGNGIRITFYHWGGKSQHNIIENNQIMSCRYGIFMYDGDHNTILKNLIVNNSLHGIYFYTAQSEFPCEYNIIANNTVNDNKQHGIYLSSICNNNTISNNTVNDNNQYGIYLQSSCNENNITYNTIERNLCGVLLYSSNYNNISENILNKNGVCIYEQYCSGNIIENNICSDSTLQTPILIDGTAAGIGANNWTWAESQSWCSGSGTWIDPYIIEGLTINGLGITEGIEILNSNVFFTIQDCMIQNSPTAIYLDNVNNSKLIFNNCSLNDEGIHLDYSNNNTIAQNIASNNSASGIYLYDSDNNYIAENVVNGNYDGIYLDTDCTNNIIIGNYANKNYDGIYIYYCDHTIITGNTANKNVNYGIYLEECNNNIILSNNVNENSDYGIHIDLNSCNNTLSGNTITYNEYGILLGDSSNNNTISGNFVNYNYLGLYLEEFSDNNTISSNSVNNNELGIRLFTNCCNNTLLGNNVNNNIYDGIILENGCESNTISENDIRNNGAKGIKIIEASDLNIITENVLYNNSYGIEVNSADYNSFYFNFFLKNGVHATDDGIDNTWNSTTIGNYWDNHTSPDLSPIDGIVDYPYTFISGLAGTVDYLPIAEDGAPSVTINAPNDAELFGTDAPSYDVTITDDYLDGMWYSLDDGLHNYTFTEFTGTIDQFAWDTMTDGVITLTFYASDTPGNIGYSNINILKDSTSPIIIINSPSPGAEFGVDAPSFIITVTDDHLDSVWYSLDSGLTTYIITTNTTINQIAWAALSEGSITITFYANDTAGNLAFEEVILTKTIPSDEFDPTMVIVTVVVSIVGGIAVIAGIYIFMKKRITAE